MSPQAVAELPSQLARRACSCRAGKLWHTIGQL